MLISGADKYLDNPKLRIKVLLITVWLLATQAMRRHALPRFKAGRRTPTLITSAISPACWIYGAFLGVAQGLAYGVMPFSGLLSGYLLVTGASLVVTFSLETHRQAPPTIVL